MGLYQYDSTEDKLNLVAGSTNFSDAPVGAIFPFGGTDIPISFLLCDGSAVSRTDYEDLFNVIGTAFGTGDGSTTFNLPDLRDKTAVGVGNGDLTSVGDSTVGKLPNITGTAESTTNASSFGVVNSDNYSVDGALGLTNATAHSKEGSSGGTSYFRTLTFDASGSNSIYTSDHDYVTPASVGVNYIIKAKMVALPADLASGVEELINTENILWENQNPDSAFLAQDVTLANDNYRYLTIYYKEYAGRNYYLSVKFPKGVGCYLNKIDVSSNDYYVYSRICSYTNSTKLLFADAYQSSQSSANNGHCIPIKIVGSMT